MALPNKHPTSNSYDYPESLGSQDSFLACCCKSIGDAFKVYRLTLGWERDSLVFKLFCHSGGRKLKCSVPIEKV